MTANPAKIQDGVLGTRKPHIAVISWSPLEHKIRIGRQASSLRDTLEGRIMDT